MDVWIKLLPLVGMVVLPAAQAPILAAAGNWSQGVIMVGIVLVNGALLWQAYQGMQP